MIEVLGDAEPKAHWSVADCFGGGSLLRCFTHRDYEMGGHTHDFVEVNIVVRGSGRHVLKEESFLTRAGDVFVVPPGVRHGYLEGKWLDVIHILIHPVYLVRHAPSLALQPGYAMLFTVEPFYRAETGFRYALKLEAEPLKLVWELCDLLDRELAVGCGAREAAEALGLYILHRLCREYTHRRQRVVGPEASREPAASLHQVLTVIGERFSEPITLDELAGVAHLQKNYFCRVFRRVMGVTAMAYLTTVRVQEGRRLLLETDQSVTAIALAVGFYDGAHFSRSFTETFGIPPSRFRRGG